ncbi:MAG: hypothetical protein KatS3mg105_3545 [Gemmatales bacterium]|nr:MAG: hypothetical protein KatS3mg105_3545 [Gemmatales bacterium]
MRSTKNGIWMFVLVTGVVFTRAVSLANAQEGGEAPAANAGHEAECQVLNLDQCIALALKQQPALQAHQSSLMAAETNRRAVENLLIPSLIARELPIRRKQAAMGVTVASAGLKQAELETIYAVTRLYYSVIFAREQRKVAQKVVGEIQRTALTVKLGLSQGEKEVRESDLNKVNMYLKLAEAKVAEAETGIRRARAALQEAIGLGACGCVEVADEGFPELTLKICLQDIINMALANRGEMIQADTVAEVMGLEVEAQKTTFRPRFHTFAAVADIHARPIPQGESNGEYRPGALGPEMPTTLVGSRRMRVERAEHFYTRATAVAEKTANLIALDAEDAFLKVEAALKQVALTRAAVEQARILIPRLEKDYPTRRKRPGAGATEELLRNYVVAAQAEAQYNEARFKLIIALAGLERATGGGFSAGLYSPIRDGACSLPRP